MKKIAFAFILMTATFAGFAQQSKYKNIDEAVEKLGPLNNFNVAVIADTITEKFADNEQKARAIFYWIANNIQLDPKGTKQKNCFKQTTFILMENWKQGMKLCLRNM